MLYITTLKGKEIIELTTNTTKGVNMRENHDYKVYLRSRPGFYEQYNGSVNVWASDEEDAIERAFDKLKRGAFFDRDKSMWIVERVEKILN